MKKLLMLGGAYSQVPAIKRAKELGYNVVTCDYLPQNPGHQYADEYINVSTTDKEGVLEAAQKVGAEGIIAYASDPSAASAAYVADKMSLQGSSFEATQVLAEKDRFRTLQKENGFNVPDFVAVTSEEELTEKLNEVPIPCIVKPIDASGSKGITKVYEREQILEAYRYANQYTRAKRVILEGLVETPYCQLHGDGFVYENKLVFLELGDQRFRNCVPIGTSCPSRIYEKMKEAVWREIEGILTAAHFATGGINVEIRITEDGEIFVIEIGPRTGGNYVPQLMEAATGFDEVTAVLQAAVGEYDKDTYHREDTRCSMQYIIGAERAGIFKNVWIHDELKPKIKHLYIHKVPGDTVEDYQNSSGVVGVAIICFDNYEQMESIIENFTQYVKVEVEE